VQAASTRLARQASGSVLVLGCDPSGLGAAGGTGASRLSSPVDIEGVEPVDTVLTTCELWRAAWDEERLAALRAALRPDGRLLFVEPVRVTGTSGVAQRLAAPSLRRRYGMSFDRVVPEVLRGAGLVPIRLDRLSLGRWGRVVSFVTGVAVPR
jgi:SAM-dependent methyltransferase